MKPEPFRIEPTFVPRIWGSRSLVPLYPKKTNLSEPIGEVWLTGVDCKVATGPFAGKTLGEAWREMPAEWRGSRFAEPGDFPLLVKFIFPTDKLSIQVHPGDTYAALHEKAAGGRGKTEMWHAISAEPNARVLVGLKPGVSKDKFLKAIASHDLEDLFESHIVNAGDTIFVPAGTAHTIGPGMVLCEVQEYSDLTYRVYDYGRIDAKGRSRELHIQKALEVLNFSASLNVTKHLSLPARISNSRRELLAACSYFAVERYDPFILQTSTQATCFDLLAILEGTGVIDGSGWAQEYQPGECWCLPANLGRYYVIPGAKLPPQAGEYKQSADGDPTSFIRAYVPELSALREELLTSGHGEMELAQTVFD